MNGSRETHRETDRTGDCGNDGNGEKRRYFGGSVYGLADKLDVGAKAMTGLQDEQPGDW